MYTHMAQAHAHTILIAKYERNHTQYTTYYLLTLPVRVPVTHGIYSCHCYYYMTVAVCDARHLA